MLQSASISQRGTFICVWCPSFCGCQPGNASWLPSSGGQQSLRSLVPQNYNKWRDSSWPAATPRLLTHSRLKNIPSLSVKEIYLLVPGASAQRVGLWFSIHLTAAEKHSETKGGECFFVFSPCRKPGHWNLLKRSLYTYLLSWVFCDCCPENTSRTVSYHGRCELFFFFFFSVWTILEVPQYCK